MTSDRAIVVLGIGNILWADEGFGVRAVEALHEAYAFPPEVTLIDGGTQGLALLPLIEAADLLVVFDAVDYGLEPGVLHLIDDDDVPRYLTAKKMSLHQTSFQDVLGLATLSGRLPGRMHLIGVQPLDLDDYGASLTAPVRARLEAAVAHAVAFLARFGIIASPRVADDPAEPLGPASVGRESYEAVA
ncbi:MAG: HyaD/HybD family hydrogenase maturation endopeptidase [Acidiphilium sp.]|nr:HyaD/HybD family hydrogenase maturation endopeptidase [Acidiphilium sp.]MDD4935097.1 HyaD/HybD family hydrogenase maturation endopeptidase [Acidiphilium sp.]